jgi:hypothetical protein
VSDDGSLRQHESALVGWLLSGMATAAALAALAAMLTLVDRFLRASRQHVPLLRLGVAGWRLRGLEAAQFGISYVLAMGGALAFGVGWGMAMTTYSIVDYPVEAIAVVIGAIVGDTVTILGEIFATTAAIGLYVAMALGYSTIYQATVKLGVWRCVVDTLEVANTAVLDRVSAAGEPSSPVGEGLADALNVGGI